MILFKDKIESILPSELVTINASIFVWQLFIEMLGLGQHIAQRLM